MRVTKSFTAAYVKTMKPAADKRLEIRDPGSKGLYLTIQTSGSKSWAMRFRGTDGRPQKLVLGPVDLIGETTGELKIGVPLSLSGARQLAAQIFRDRAFGKDVVGEHKAAKAKGQVAAQNTFGQCARDFVERHAKKTRRWQQTSRLLGLGPDGSTIKDGLADRWDMKAIADITAHDIYTVTEEARMRGVPGLEARNTGPSEARARHFHSALAGMMGWCHKHRKIEANPAFGVHRPEPGQQRDRVLTEAELVKIWKASEKLGEPFGRIIRLLILTGQRLNEASGLAWSEVNCDMWTLPGARAKNGRSHAVPLSTQAQAILANQPRFADLCFTTNGLRPVSGWSKAKRRLDGMVDIPPWRLHDIRRTVATMVAERGTPPHIVEAILNHISGSKAGVAGLYNLAAYIPERRAALQAWADHVQQLTNTKELAAA